MALHFINLDQRTRNLMLLDIEHDGAALYLSGNLSPRGRADYPDLLREGVRTGDDTSLATGIASRLNSHERPRPTKNGNVSTPKMRSNAHEMLAEGEFNRFYIRALCRRAIEDGIPHLVIYRAKAVEEPLVGFDRHDRTTGRSY